MSLPFASGARIFISLQSSQQWKPSEGPQLLSQIKDRMGCANAIFQDMRRSIAWLFVGDSLIEGGLARQLASWIRSLPWQRHLPGAFHIPMKMRVSH
jgi:hypothetical protein